MKRFKLFIIFVFFGVLLAGCGPSFPKETLDVDVARLVYRESGRKPVVSVIGNTMYIDLMLGELASQESEVVNDAMRVMQRAVFASMRAALSSDANIEFIIVTAYDSPEYNIAIQSVQNMGDIKGFMFRQMSRGDFQSRSVFIIEGAPHAAVLKYNRHGITEADYVGKLILSQATIAGSANPLIAAIINTLNLRYLGKENGILYYVARSDASETFGVLLGDIFQTQGAIQAERYRLEIDGIRIININGEIILDVSLP